VKDLLRRNRAAILLGTALVGVLALLALVVGGASQGVLDPDAYNPEGSHALAVLLRDRGVEVVRTTDVPSTVAATTADSTLFIPEPSLLSPDELEELAALPGEHVVTEAAPDELAVLDGDAEVLKASKGTQAEPGCDLVLAANAGRSLTGGLHYSTGEQATSCFGGTLLAIPTRHLVLLGNSAALTNDRLDEDGNAALGIGLLGRTSKLVWLMPSPTRTVIGVRPVRSPDQLLPEWVRDGRRQLYVVLVLLALWRGRRLGRVVLERLPVVVRAAETVEGHGRLYRAARARGSAAESLRAAARRTLVRVAHGGTTPTPEVLSALVAERTGRDPVGVRLLLYGPPPPDDAALVGLADALDALTHDALTREATRS
jgi:hypothetical protein